MNPSPQADTLIGQRLAGYRLTGLLGRSNVSSVYRAEDVLLGRPVAVKVLPGWMVASDSQRVEQFLREARSAAQLQHPHVVTIYQVGQQGEHYFVAMEYMGGGSLQDLLNQGQRLSPQAAATVIRQAVRGLAAAHRVGIIHRDVKPSNLLMTEDGIVKVADFGLAGRMEVAAEGGLATVVEGTPRYIAPELCLGHAPSPASDIYALGMTWYAMLTGSAAFSGKDSSEIFRKHVRAPVPDVTQIRPDVPPTHTSLITQCLSKLPEDRFESAAHLLTGLDLVLGTSSPIDGASAAMVEAASLRDLVLASKAAAHDVDLTSAAQTRASAAAEQRISPPSIVIPVGAWLALGLVLLLAIIILWRVLTSG